MNRNQFIDMLIDRHVPFECWGACAGQKIDRLYADFVSQKRRFIKYQDGRLLVRSVYIALKVRYRNLVLIQTFNESISGPHPCPSVWTTYEIVPRNKSGLDIMVDWVYRTIFFEKKLPEKYEFWLNRAEVLKGKPVLDPIYPGVWSVNTVFVYSWDLPDMFYDQSGYVLETKDTASLYEWVADGTTTRLLSNQTSSET